MRVCLFVCVHSMCPVPSFLHHVPTEREGEGGGERERETEREGERRCTFYLFT